MTTSETGGGSLDTPDIAGQTASSVSSQNPCSGLKFICPDLCPKPPLAKMQFLLDELLAFLVASSHGEGGSCRAALELQETLMLDSGVWLVTQDPFGCVPLRQRGYVFAARTSGKGR